MRYCTVLLVPVVGQVVAMVTVSPGAEGPELTHVCIPSAIVVAGTHT